MNESSGATPGDGDPLDGSGTGRLLPDQHTATAFYEDRWTGPTGWRYFGWYCSCGHEEYVLREDGGLDECERLALAHSSAAATGPSSTNGDAA